MQVFPKKTSPDLDIGLQYGAVSQVQFQNRIVELEPRGRDGQPAVPCQEVVIGRKVQKAGENFLAIFDEKIEIRERCKGVHCVDLGESFPTSIYLQKSASIQPRTSPSKFGEKFNSLFTSLLSSESR